MIVWVCVGLCDSRDASSEIQAFNKLKCYSTLYFDVVLNLCHPFNNL